MEINEFSYLDCKLRNLEKHISIIGKTNTGKTTFAKMLHEYTDKISIFFNTQDEDVEGYKTKKWDYHLLEEHKKINFIPDWRSEIATIQLQEIKDDLQQLMLRIGDRSRKTRFVIFVDEAHEIALQGIKDTPLHFIFKRGKRHGITGVSITQSPADLDKGIVKQADYHVIFDVNDFENQYFKAKNIPIEGVKKYLVDSHNFTIYDNRSFLGIYSIHM